MSSKQYDDRDRYEIDLHKLRNHTLIVIRLYDNARPTKRDFTLNIKPGGYCIRNKYLKKFEKCMTKTPNVEALIAFLEVYDFSPKMTRLERDVLNYWKYRRLAFKKK